MGRLATCAYALGMLVASVGVVIALWPADIFGPCPFLIRQANAANMPLVFAYGLGAWNRFWQPRLRFDSSTGLRLYTRAELREYDGEDESKPILLGMNGDVFDVTEKGKMYYGKDAGYHLFAGHDSTRALSLGSLELADVLNFDCSDFTEAQNKTLLEQHAFYLGKYPRVGVLADEPDLRADRVAAYTAYAAQREAAWEAEQVAERIRLAADLVEAERVLGHAAVHGADPAAPAAGVSLVAEAEPP